MSTIAAHLTPAGPPETGPARRDTPEADPATVSGAGRRPELTHRARPCGDCPWRRDAPCGHFPAERFEALEVTHGAPGAEAGLDAPMFACHASAEDSPAACAGWLAVEGHNHLGVRLAVIRGALSPDALEAGEGWPVLYGDYAEMAAANGARPDTATLP
jgi:hypothetical protein